MRALRFAALAVALVGVVAELMVMHTFGCDLKLIEASAIRFAGRDRSAHQSVHCTCDRGDFFGVSRALRWPPALRT
jgi:hypothetical protein